MTSEKGVAVIEAALETMSASPGVYRMLDAKGDALYVGKARSLKRRVTSYTQIGRLPERLRRMVSETVTMETVTTHTEAEALLLIHGSRRNTRVQAQQVGNRACVVRAASRADRRRVGHQRQ